MWGCGSQQPRGVGSSRDEGLGGRCKRLVVTQQSLKLKICVCVSEMNAIECLLWQHYVKINASQKDLMFGRRDSWVFLFTVKDNIASFM